MDPKRTATLEGSIQEFAFYLNQLKVMLDADFYTPETVDYIPGTEERREELRQAFLRATYWARDLGCAYLGLFCGVEKQRGHRLKDINTPLGR